jgi:ABC-type uncharacterized transport system ATPase subunit
MASANWPRYAAACESPWAAPSASRAGTSPAKQPTRQFIEAGVGFVPEDRQEAGSVGIFNLVENLMLKDYQEDRFKQGIWLNWTKARR